MLDASWVRAAFPSTLRAVADEVAAVVVPGQSHAPVSVTEVVVGDELVLIPHRLYDDVSLSARFGTGRAATVAACLRTRHHDGRVRQRAVRELLAGDAALEPWVVPYVVLLVGEYVVEIVEDVAAALTDLDVDGSVQRRAYGRALAQNPELVRLTSARAVSYWDCYYRARYPQLDAYPGRRLAEALARAAAAGSSGL